MPVATQCFTTRAPVARGFSTRRQRLAAAQPLARCGLGGGSWCSWALEGPAAAATQSIGTAGQGFRRSGACSTRAGVCAAAAAGRAGGLPGGRAGAPDAR